MTYLDLLSPLCRVVQLWRLTTSAPPSSLVILQRPHRGQDTVEVTHRGQDTVEVTHGYIPAVNQGSTISLVCQVKSFYNKIVSYEDAGLEALISVCIRQS